MPTMPTMPTMPPMPPMQHLTQLPRILRLVALAAIAIGCAADTTEVCPSLPCALSIAVEVQVVSATGAPVDTVSLQVAGPSTFAVSCSGARCTVPGPAGAYQLTISAPGYQAAHLDVVVHSQSDAKCSCHLATTELRTVTLVPVG